MSLQSRQTIEMPPRQAGGFDHADVHPPSGRVFVAHTAFGQFDAQRQRLYLFLPRACQAVAYDEA